MNDNKIGACGKMPALIIRTAKEMTNSINNIMSQIIKMEIASQKEDAYHELSQYFCKQMKSSFVLFFSSNYSNYFYFQYLFVGMFI